MSEALYDITEGDWRVRAEDAGAGNAHITFWYRGEVFREIAYPAYKVWNIPAHLADIIAEFEQGMALASWTGIGSIVEVRG